MNQIPKLPTSSAGNTALSALLCAALATTPLSARSPDRDGDGNSDIWQIMFAAPSLNPDVDSDGDGKTNGEEAVAGTDPLDPNSCFRIESVECIEDPAGDEIAIRYFAIGAKSYQLQESTTLQPGSWSNLGAPLIPIHRGEIEQRVPKPRLDGRHFYRVRVTEIDRDGDGLSASEELAIGTSDENPNTSGERDRDDCVVAREWLTANDYGTNPGNSKPNLREVDVAFLQSGSISQTNFTFLVTATGTGSWHQLSSWNVPTVAADPVLLHTIPPVEGWHPKVAKVPVGPNLEGQPRFVTGTIRSNGDLFLSSRQLNLGGAFTHHDSVGFGANAGVDVFDYDIAVRPFSDRSLISHYHVVTPVLTKANGGGPTQLRVVSWHLDAATGHLTGLQESGPLPLTALPSDGSEARVAITHLEGIQYVVTYTDSAGRLNERFVLVENDDGKVVYGGGDFLLKTLHGDDNFSILQEASALAKVTETGFLTANRDLVTGRLGLSVWERRAEGFLNYEPYNITDATEDLSPFFPGVTLLNPVLTNSWRYLGGHAGDRSGEALATGDFNGDGRDDLAVGAPGHEVNDLNGVGAVHIVHAHPFLGMMDQPLTATWSQDSAGVDGIPEFGDNFGDALAVADFNSDGHDDLAIGSPGEDVGITSDGGAVNILYGGPAGLSAAGNDIIVQGDLGHSTGAFDWFGSELATGHFNDDNHPDLAISAPGRDINGHPSAGAVYIVWGGPGGLTTVGAQYLHQDAIGVPDQSEDFDSYGNALVVGDFNGNGIDDLAVGVRAEDVGALANAGGVHVHYGTAAGLSGGSFLTQDGFLNGPDLEDSAEGVDLFGHSLAAGDFDNDGVDDLAIGVPGEDDGDVENAGGINILYGTVLGLTQFGNQFITQDNFVPGGGGLPSASEEGDELGRAMVAGDFDGDGNDDLAAGASHEGIGTAKPDAGAIFEIRGSPTGLTAAGSAVWHQDSGGAKGVSATGDKYGDTLVSGHFDLDGRCDLVVGIPGKDREEDTKDGGVHIIPGSSSGLSMTPNDEWFPRVVEPVRGMVTDLAREEAGGTGAGKLFDQIGLNEWVHIASTTKCMTLLLAVEAIEDGIIDRWDDVNVSELAGKGGGSALPYFDPPTSVPPSVDDLGLKTLNENGDGIAFLAPGDTMPLNLLLHAMMMWSCNKSSAAIGQHVALHRTGDPDEFLNLMNQRALDLGMTSGALEADETGTLFGHPAHGCVTMPQHLITLLREGSKHPLFLQLASQEIYGITPSLELCGTGYLLDDDCNQILVNGVPALIAKCNNPFGNIQNLSGYPGRRAWKGGNGGGWWTESQANGAPAKPSDISWCTSSQVGIVERASRTLLMALQQTGNKSRDTKALLDHGFRKIFTPDRRERINYPEPGGVIGNEGPIRVKDFAIDAISSRLCVMAVIDDFEELRLQIWDTNTTSGSITALGTATTDYALLDAVTWSPPTLTGLVALPTSGAIGDYLSANLEGDHLQLEIWRIGAGH